MKAELRNRKVRRQALEIDFFAEMLAACRGAAEAAGVDYARLVYPYLQKEMSLATPIPLQRLCRLAHISRAGFYRWQETAKAARSAKTPQPLKSDPMFNATSQY